MDGHRSKAAWSALSPRKESNGAWDESLEQALAAAGDGAFAVDSEGRVLLWNRAAERVLGWTAWEVQGKLCCDLLRGVGGDGTRLCYRGCHATSLVKESEPVQRFEMETRTKAGKRLWLDMSVLDVAPVERAGARAVHVFSDVTATKNLVQFVRERLIPPAASNGNEKPALTRREVEILRMMADGANTKALAERLHVSPATIRNHAQNIFAKLDVHSRLEAVAWANRTRLT